VGGEAGAKGALAERGFTAIAIDSRQASPGSLFVALPGEKQEGHDFVLDAFRRGATAALVSRPVPGCETIWPVQGPLPDAGSVEPVGLLVPDVLRALQDLAAAWRRQHTACRVVAVTGSIGKTSTKEAVAAVLSRRYRVLKSEGNYNNEIGLPLTLLQLEPDHRWAVLEMGMYAPGEIARLVEVAGPAVGVVTNVGPVHLERLGSIEAIAQAKAELPRGLPGNGVLVLNGDDPWVRGMARETSAGTVITYGLGARCDLRAESIESRGLQGIEARIRHHDQSQPWPLSLPWPGRHNVYVALAAAAVGLAESLTWEEIAAGLNQCSSLGRLRLVRGTHGATILDDTYNASPASTVADLDLLADLDGRRLAILGDMLELGSYEEEAHREVARRAAEVLDILATVGPRARWIAEEAQCLKPTLAIRAFESCQEAVAWLRPELQTGDYLLVKGSRAMALEEVVAALREEEV